MVKGCRLTGLHSRSQGWKNQWRRKEDVNLGLWGRRSVRDENCFAFLALITPPDKLTKVDKHLI